MNRSSWGAPAPPCGRLRRSIADWRLLHAERRLWAQAPDVASLRELTARWCLGELSWAGVGQPAPRDAETVEIGEVLAAANRSGLLTSHSQPAAEFHDGTVQQRAFVEGYASPDVEEKLRRLIAGTRLRIASQDDAQWRTTYTGAAPAERYRDADGGWREGYGQFGARLSASAMSLEFTGISGEVWDEIDDMARITIWDPQWEPSRLLWDRLAQRDWDNPAPPVPPSSAPAPSVMPPRAATTHAGGSSTMSSIEEVRTGIAAANDQASQSLGALQQAHSSIEQAQGIMMRVSQGSAQADVSDVNGMLAHAAGSVVEVPQMVTSAIRTAESVGARL